MPTWMIEGVWSGYRQGQERVCHREYTTNKKYAEKVGDMHGIRFTDGTMMYLRVRQRQRSDGKRLPDMRSYTSLIRDCANFGVNSVDALGDKLAELRAEKDRNRA